MLDNIFIYDKIIAKGGSCLKKWTLNRVASPVKVNYDKGYGDIALLYLGEHIVDKANVLYDKYISKKYFARRKDCLNFPELEEVCKKYNE